jgi:hypothetical protein
MLAWGWIVARLLWTTGLARPMAGMGWKADVDDGGTWATPKAMLRTGIFAAALIALSGCSDGCKNSRICRVDAPDGLNSAVMFQRDCGATTGFTTQISVVRQGSDPTGGGNTFRADDDHGAATSGDWGGPWAEIRWLAPDHLLIRYADKSRVFEQQAEVAGVKISYQEVAR